MFLLNDLITAKPGVGSFLCDYNLICEVIFVTKRKDRNSSIELLRILTMFTIVMHHYAYHGTFYWQTFNPQTVGALRVNAFLQYFGKTGVAIFVMIGAYFLCEKKFNFYRPINLLLTMMFYSFLIYIVLRIFYPQAIWMHGWINMLLPFPLPSGYWFVYSYLLMLGAMPFLNIIISHLKSRQLLLLICLMTITWSFLVIGIWLFSNKPDTEPDSFGYSYGTYFWLLYLVAAYLRKYSGKHLNSARFIGISALLSMILLALFTLLIHSQHTSNGVLDFCDLNSPFVLLTSVFTFSFFKNLHFHSPIINYLAGSMFGVYLIHEDSFIRPLVWHNLISSAKVAHSAMLYVGQAIGFSLLVFIACVLIDIIIRRLLIAKPLQRFSIWLNKWITNRVILFVNGK